MSNSQMVPAAPKLTWEQGDVVKFGSNNERDVEVFSGLFRYSGFGLGTYYSATGSAEFVDADIAYQHACAEGVPYIRWDSECEFDPPGYKAILAAADRASRVSSVADRWLNGFEAKNLNDAKELASLVVSRLNLTMTAWEMSGHSISPWAYARVVVGDDVVMMVGASAGGVVSVDGKPHSPVDGLVNVTFDRVEKSIAARVAVMTPLFEYTARTDRLRAAIPDADGSAGAAFRDALESMSLALEAKGVSADVIGSALTVALDAYGNNMTEGRDHQTGYVLAFPGASEAEANELFETLRMGGNNVVRVRGDVEQAALSEVAQSAEISADNLQP